MGCDSHSICGTTALSLLEAEPDWIFHQAWQWGLRQMDDVAGSSHPSDAAGVSSLHPSPSCLKPPLKNMTALRRSSIFKLPSLFINLRSSPCQVPFLLRLFQVRPPLSCNITTPNRADVIISLLLPKHSICLQLTTDWTLMTVSTKSSLYNIYNNMSAYSATHVIIGAHDWFAYLH